MTPTTLAMASLTSLAAAGVLAVISGLTPNPPRQEPPTPPLLANTLRRWSQAAGNLNRRWLLVGLAAGVVLAAVTRMVALVLLTPTAAVLLPTLMRSPQTNRINRLQALETWARALSGVLVAGSGVEEAIRASLHTAPEAIRPSVAALAARIRAGQRLEPALRDWADELADPTSDMVAAALIQGSQRHGGLARALDELADIVSDRVRVSQQIEADRATPRTTVKAVTAITLVLMSVMVLANPSLTAAYSTPMGQVVFAILASAYLVSLWWIHNVVSRAPNTRFLTRRKTP